MFDKLIVSDEQGAEFKGRSRYFMVSTFVVGILFITAVVFSLYAADIGLGSDELEVSMMVAPVTPTARVHGRVPKIVTPTAPEPAKPMRVQDGPQMSQSDKPSRAQNIMRPEETPGEVPTSISVDRSPYLSRPPGTFLLNGIDKLGQGSPDGNMGRSDTIGSSSEATSDQVASSEKIPDPPPVIKPKPPTPTGPVSMGVVNGRATSLPKPPYPAAAIAVGATGQVTVQVLIDESGRVVSAKAINGHLLLKREAERAALSARFSPTLLSKVPVKVTGVIVYNFKRS